MEDKFGWCFIGAGSIVQRVIPEMHKTNGGYLASICSTTFTRAEEIAEQYGAKAYHTAQEALSDPNVRAAYIATPHSNHMESALLAIDMGVPVLCEKPFAVNLIQARKMINAARAKNVYIAEGMWTRVNPVFKEVLAWISEGRIGEVRSLTATMAGKGVFDPTARVFDYNRAGGMFLDVGVYTIAASQFIFGDKPDRIAAMGKLEYNGVDTMCAILLGYRNGIARLFTSSEVSGGTDAVVHGGKGDILINNIAAPTRAMLVLDSGEEICSTAKLAYPDEGFVDELNAVMDDIREGRIQNEYITHAYTLEVMEILDTVRSQINLKYPID